MTHVDCTHYSKTIWYSILALMNHCIWNSLLPKQGHWNLTREGSQQIKSGEMHSSADDDDFEAWSPTIIFANLMVISLTKLPWLFCIHDVDLFCTPWILASSPMSTRHREAVRFAPFVSCRAQTRLFREFSIRESTAPTIPTIRTPTKLERMNNNPWCSGSYLLDLEVVDLYLLRGACAIF
jgi:hypothetical protein